MSRAKKLLTFLAELTSFLLVTGPIGIFFYFVAALGFCYLSWPMAILTSNEAHNTFVTTVIHSPIFYTPVFLLSLLIVWRLSRLSQN